MRVCVFCKSRYQKGSGITFHRFPTDSTKELWLKSMKTENWSPKSTDHLCSKHFTEDCLNRHPARTSIVSGSVPTLFLENTPSEMIISTSCVSDTARENNKLTSIDANHDKNTKKVPTVQYIANSKETRSKSKIKSKTVPDMGKATINYMRNKMGCSKKILLADDAKPTKSHGQEISKRDLTYPGTSQKVLLKRLRFVPIKESQENVNKAHSDSLQKHDTKKQGVIEPEEVTPLKCQQCNKDVANNTRIYKCVQCVDMLLCAACQTDERHQQHCVMRFPSTRLYDKMKDLFESLQKGFNMKLSLHQDSASINSLHNDATVTNNVYKNNNKVLMPIYLVQAGPSTHIKPPSHIRATTKVSAITPDKKHSESMVSSDESPVILPKREPESDPEPDPLELRDNIQTSVRPSPQLAASTTFVKKTKRKLSELHEEIMIKEESVDMLVNKTDLNVHTQSSPLSPPMPPPPPPPVYVFKIPRSNAEKWKSYRNRKKDANGIKRVKVINAEKYKMLRLRKRSFADGFHTPMNKVLYSQSTSKSPLTFVLSDQPITKDSTSSTGIQ